MSIGGRHQSLRAGVLARANYRCEIADPQVCTGIATEADHIIARIDGGPSTLDNYRAACRACNARGGAGITAARRRAKKIAARKFRPAVFGRKTQDPDDGLSLSPGFHDKHER